MSLASKNSSYFESILNTLRRNGIDGTQYRKIGDAFTRDIMHVSPKILNEILEYFIEYKKDKLYVNEIKSFLEKNNKELFIKYGRIFESNRGVKVVFGLEQNGDDFAEHVINDYAVNNYVTNADNKHVEEKNNIKIPRPRKNRAKNDIRKAAKAAAIQKQYKKVERNAEKKKRRSEYEEMIRKQN